VAFAATGFLQKFRGQTFILGVLQATTLPRLIRCSSRLVPCRFDVTQAIPPVSSPCEAEAFTAEDAEHAESENQDSLAIFAA
jgi:hypothetical protein